MVASHVIRSDASAALPAAAAAPSVSAVTTGAGALPFTSGGVLKGARRGDIACSHA